MADAFAASQVGAANAVMANPGDTDRRGAMTMADFSSYAEALSDSAGFDPAHRSCGSEQGGIDASGTPFGACVQHLVAALMGA